MVLELRSLCGLTSKNRLSAHIYSSFLVFVLLSRKYKFECKVFRIIFIFHSSKECKIAEEVKFARIAHDYQFYVKRGGVVRKFVVICFAFC